MSLPEYIKQIKSRFSSNISTEHSYRSDLQILLNELVDGITVTNEPKRQKCGAPDYIIERKKIPIGYIEAKDINVDLNKTEKTNQLERYLKSLDNLILTDYLEFRFYKYGNKVKEIKLATIENNKIVSCPENFEPFINHINDFCNFKGQTIKSAEKLAKMMAQKARMMEEVLFKAVNEEAENNSLRDQLKAFRQILIHDLDEKTFSDIYAQTIAYGLFAARLHDTTLDDFSRQEAKDLIPKSNPFLKNLFYYISGPELDDRVVWIVDDLAEIFRSTNLQSILSDFGKATKQTDPFLHFYETFLSEYDPKLRKLRGVYYTPEPIVKFIVRAVDDLLKTEFNLSQGIADTSKIKIKSIIEGTSISKGKNKGKDVFEEIEVHKVQILDPATGTGTFLFETIKQIYQKYKDQKGIWSSYVENHLIPRINGFEILMASYTMCHLKLELLLRETGYKIIDEKNQKRLKVFLTNSLEDSHPDTGTLFASWLSKEATEANYVKRDTPVMVILGNPPYSVSSSNKSEWIESRIADYKKNLNEKNIQPLSDDYIKFIRLGQHYICKTGEGILAYISNNSFIDGLIHRQMRKHLLESFDKIYIIDLHGNSNRKETTIDGKPDENVFDIQQGVSINIFIKTGKKVKKDYAKVFHYSILGKREVKYDFLMKNHINSIPFNDLQLNNNELFFVYKNLDDSYSYSNNFSIIDLFIKQNTCINTEFDELVLKDTQSQAELLLKDLQNKTAEQILSDYNFNEKQLPKINNAKNDIIENKPIITKIVYRPFDIKHCIYTGKSNGIMGRPRHDIMKHMILGENLGLISMRQYAYDVPDYCYTFISKDIAASRLFISNKGYCSIFPLYIYHETDIQQDIEGKIERMPNLNLEIVKQIADKINLKFIPEKIESDDKFAPIDILDYIYAVLYSPSYREKYKEFLKIDFPKVPYPENAEIFWKFVKHGRDLRRVHLLENQIVDNLITSYPMDGNNIVDKVKYENSKVFINEIQYFDKVPEIVWNLYIGGYQPAQKWLKDRKDRKLSVDDIMHYQKIIVVLNETHKIMNEIDKTI